MDNIFSSLIGNDIIKNNIGKDIRAGHNSHAYIIVGDKGSGKHTIAELIASAVSCEHRFDSSYPLPCGECLNCRKIKKDIFTDIVRISQGDKSSIGVDAIRTIREGLYVTPNDSDMRTYIIEGADKLTPQAQNALLLTLEEPPSFALFLLLCEDQTKLLETIRSRAQIIRCEVFSSAEVARFLKRMPGGEELSRKNPAKFAAAVSLSGGSLGKAEQLLRGSEEGSTLLKSRETAAKLISLLSGSKSSPLLKMLPSLPKSAEDVKSILYLIDNGIRDLCSLKRSDECDSFLVFFTSIEEALECASDMPYRKLLHIHDCICTALRRLDGNVPVKTVYTDMVFSCLKHKRLV